MKFECVSHYQKRVGSRLHNLEKNTKGLSGKEKFTNTKIVTMQNYFGIALRSNVGNLAVLVIDHCLILYDLISFFFFFLTLIDACL